MQALTAGRLLLDARPSGSSGWRDRLKSHLLRLNPESRLNRFLAWSSDAAVARYCETANPDLIVHAWSQHRLCGLAEVHIRPDEPHLAEIALSVEEEYRRNGVGEALFTEALAESRRRGVQDVWIYYLKTNEAIRRIADRAGFARQPNGDPSVVEAHIRHADGPSA